MKVMPVALKGIHLNIPKEPAGPIRVNTGRNVQAARYISSSVPALASVVSFARTVETTAPAFESLSRAVGADPPVPTVPFPRTIEIKSPSSFVS